MSTPSDNSEQEADSVAERVARTPLDTQGGGTAPHAPVPTSGTPFFTASAGSALPERTRQGFGQRMGWSFDAVRIHRDEPAANAADLLQARAFTVGSHIFFGRDQYDPESGSGQRLIAHELTHVVQQRQTGPAPVQRAAAADRPEIAAHRGPVIQRSLTGALIGAGIGAGLGALVGGILGGGLGALVGGLLGAGVGALVGAFASGGAGTTWSVEEILAVLCNPQDRWVIDRIQSDGVKIVAFSDAIDRWRDDATGAETEVSLADTLRGNTDSAAKTIRLNEKMPSEEAAITLYHEMSHWKRPSSASQAAAVQQEIDVRIETEAFMIRHGFPPTKPSYRTAAGAVDKAAIAADIKGSPHYNPSTRTRVGRRYIGDREIKGWRCP